MPPLAKWSIGMLVPLFTILVFGTWYCLAGCCSASRRDATLVRMTVLEAGVQVMLVWQFASVMTSCFRILDCDKGTTGLLIMDPSETCPLDGTGPVSAAVLSFAVLLLYFVLPNVLLVVSLVNSVCR